MTSRLSMLTANVDCCLTKIVASCVSQPKSRSCSVARLLLWSYFYYPAGVRWRNNAMFADLMESIFMGLRLSSQRQDQDLALWHDG